MKKSNILLYVGLAILAVGIVLSMMNIQPYSDYALVAGAVVVIFRGAFRSRERVEEQEQQRQQDDQTEA